MFTPARPFGRPAGSWLTGGFRRALSRPGGYQRSLYWSSQMLFRHGERFGDATVERQCGGSDEPRIVAREESDRRRCFLQGAEPPHRPVHQSLLQRTRVAVEDRPLMRAID